MRTRPLTARMTVGLAAALATLPAFVAAQPSADDLRARADELLQDWKAGRLSESYEQFSAGLRRLVTPTQLQASLDGVGAALGEYVATEAGRLAEERIDGQPARVLVSTLRFEHGEASARFAFVEEAGAWRLRHLAIDLPGGKPPQAQTKEVAAIATEIVSRLARDGLETVVRLLPEKVRQEYGDETLRRLYARTQKTLGPLRGFSLEPPAPLGEQCRQSIGEGRFEHGEATLKLALCPDPSVWRLIAISVEPRMTSALFSRFVRVDVADALGSTEFDLKCAETVVPVNAETTCEVTAGARRRLARVRRIEEGDLEVALEP